MVLQAQLLACIFKKKNHVIDWLFNQNLFLATFADEMAVLSIFFFPLKQYNNYHSGSNTIQYKYDHHNSGIIHILCTYASEQSSLATFPSELNIKMRKSLRAIAQFSKCTVKHIIMTISAIDVRWMMNIFGRVWPTLYNGNSF